MTSPNWGAVRFACTFAACQLSRLVLRLCCPQVSDYWRMVIEINDYQKSRYVERVIKSMFNTVSKKKIAVGAGAVQVESPKQAPFLHAALLVGPARSDPRAVSTLTGCVPCAGAGLCLQEGHG